MRAVIGRIGRVLAALMVLLGAVVPAHAAKAIQEGEYQLPAGIDPTVATEMATELWARVYRPVEAGTYPLLVFLHGNHGTCGRWDPGLGVRIDDNVQYTDSGTCPQGYVPSPSHNGYHYLARALAGDGFVVVSINANRGVNAAPGVSGDAGLNLRRGRLVLRHLQQLAEWHAGVGAPPPSLGFGLAGLLDLSEVGLMGHSRGGEGMRAALAQYNDGGSPWPARIGAMSVRALFEIGPVDGQTSRVLNAPGLPWQVLLPGCDGDVSDLQGVRPFDRMMAVRDTSGDHPRGSLQVFGANHNFYNSEWQVAETSSCIGQTPLFGTLVGSPAQRQTALQSARPFFRAHVGAKAKARRADLLDPSIALPAKLDQVTRFARGYTPSTRSSHYLVIDDFTAGTGSSSQGQSHSWAGLSSYSHGTAGSFHDPSQRAASVAWATAAASRYLQLNLAPAGQGVDVSAYPALEFRMGLQCGAQACTVPSDPAGDLDLSISLVHADGSSSAAVPLRSVAHLYRPAGAWSNVTLMRTVRVPLTAFTGVQPSQVRGVRFTFDRQSNRSLYLGHARFTTEAAGGEGQIGRAHV